jgi:hypothetical protein
MYDLYVLHVCVSMYTFMRGRIQMHVIRVCTHHVKPSFIVRMCTYSCALRLSQVFEYFQDMPSHQST